ncbi:MAG: hypothetical protein Q8P35_01175 [Candidatus Yanofskybacteria bacterium]|nr:hypothetical protein [Candidatus Yanofskybacteria bacterium]
MSADAVEAGESRNRIITDVKTAASAKLSNSGVLKDLRDTLKGFESELLQAEVAERGLDELVAEYGRVAHAIEAERPSASEEGEIDRVNRRVKERREKIRRGRTAQDLKRAIEYLQEKIKKVEEAEAF